MGALCTEHLGLCCLHLHSLPRQPREREADGQTEMLFRLAVVPIFKPGVIQLLNIKTWCSDGITSTLYLLSTGRIPSGTGRMGPRSMSVGPSIGGRSDLPPGPIWKRCSSD